MLSKYKPSTFRLNRAPDLLSHAILEEGHRLAHELLTLLTYKRRLVNTTEIDVLRPSRPEIGPKSLAFRSDPGSLPGSHRFFATATATRPATSWQCSRASTKLWHGGVRPFIEGSRLRSTI